MNKALGAWLSSLGPGRQSPMVGFWIIAAYGFASWFFGKVDLAEQIAIPIVLAVLIACEEIYQLRKALVSVEQ